MPFLILFIVIPVIELWLLIKVGSHIGALATVALVLFTAMVGLALLRVQGLATLARLQRKAQTGEIPLPEMVEGIFLAVGGALLLTPGFMTDALGFACLLPGIRQVLIGHLLHRFIVRGSMQGGFQSYHRSSTDDNIIEGECQPYDESQDSTDSNPNKLK